MKSTFTYSSLIGFNIRLLTLLGMVFCLQTGNLSAQLIIDPATVGGFESGPTFADNGWQVANAGATNSWYLGTVPAGFFNRSAYISNDGGASHAYTSLFSPSVVHFYRDVTFPAGVMTFNLSFNFVGDGETNWDELLVSWAPTYFSPQAGNINLGTGLLPAPAVNIARIDNRTSVTTINISFNGGAALGNCESDVTRRLIFTWKTDLTQGDQPPAAIDNIRLEGTPAIQASINDPSDRCTNAADMSFTGSPIPSGGAIGTFYSQPDDAVFINTGPGTALLDVSATPPGVYNVFYDYEMNGCLFSANTVVEIKGAPMANVKPTLINCVEPGTELQLSAMFDTIGNTPGGAFSLLSGPSGLASDSTLIVPPGGGCYQLRYTVTDNPNGCPGGPFIDEAHLQITVPPTPEFEVLGASTPACTTDNSVPVEITRTSTGAMPVLTLNGDTISFGLIDLPAPSGVGSITYKFCLTETSVVPPSSCGPSLPGAKYDTCVARICRNIVVFNDGQDCGADAPFPSECPPDFDATDVCDVESNSSLNLSCSFFTLTGPNLIEATLTPIDAIATCDQEEVCLDWEGTLPGVLGDIAAGGPTLSQLNPATEIICDIITFEICIPLPLVPDICIDPIPLGSWEDYCDQTIGQIIFGILGDLLGGDGGGGTIVADTDGDGNFDYAAYDYNFPAQSNDANEEPACVPNNVTTPQGTITVRNVVSWPFAPEGVCGVVTSQEINLLELLPIGAIPLVGIIVEDLLAAASCNVNLVFSDEETVEIPVLNNKPPVFANCNEAGYVFSEDNSCNTEANWSIPIAYDDCYGGVLPYIGRTSTVNTSFFSGIPTPLVDTTQSGVYQTFGPLPGSDLPNDSFLVVYTAYNCAGVPSTCSFVVEVTSGDPILECPKNLTVKSDVDQCQAMVTGLAPLQGIGCNTVINYLVDYDVTGYVDVSTSSPVTPTNVHNDASGLSYPVGTTEITYHLLSDINGDGDTSDYNEKQQCMFTVTVEDRQKPEAICINRDIQLDNMGMVVINAVDMNDGVPFVDGGSTDNCGVESILIARPGGTYGPSITYDCDDEGGNFVNLQVTDIYGNVSNCLAYIKVRDFFDGFKISFALPELCLEANNPEQFDFNNYMNITLPNGTSIRHSEVENHPLLGDAIGAWGISAFLPSVNSPSVDPGTITPDGVYTPGTGSGYVTISYVLVLPGFTPPPNGNMPLATCFEIAHTTFELRQPLVMGSPECQCVEELERIVDLDTVRGGLEPYRIQYSGVRLDVDGDGDADDQDGIYTYDAANGHDITDFKQYLGQLRVVYTQPVWSFTIVDARGCEIFRSGSCDNDDVTEGPQIVCPASNHILTTEEFLCESQYTWQHPTPSDNCAVTLYDMRIQNPDGTIEGPVNLNAILYAPPLSYYNPFPPNNPPFPDSFYYHTYDFELGLSVITYYAEDALGNFTTCSFQITVSDNDPPHFINCPYPPVVQNAESGHCDAYVNFTLPLATDNCDNTPTVVQIDQTGLSTGSRFPVGTTIMYWEARDNFDNKDTCQVKVIVNDYWQDPLLTCPANVEKNNDPWLCGAVVNNIAPVVDGPCKNNYGVTYTIYGDAALTQVKDCGVTNASGEFFDVGDSWVKYTVQNQPLLLITEVSQSGAVDRLEISNLGPADIDISCLLVNRISVDPSANQTIGPVTLLPSLAGTILPVGGTKVFDFAFNGSANMPACYTISYMGTIFDEVSTNGYAGCNGFTGLLNGGDVIRKCEDDTDTAADWVLAQPCYPLTIGAINQDLEVMADNGTQTSLQSIEPNKVSCTFKVTVKDAENPFCGKLTSNTTYNGAGIPNISAATCNRSTITIPPGNCIIGDIVFNRTGTATPQNSTMTLISPKGIKVVITELPDDSLSTLFAQKAEGTWTLDVVPFPGQTPTITGWSLTVNCIAPFDVPNQVLPNQAGQCGAPFTWTHPWFVDNCFNGTISVAYTTNNAACKPTDGVLLGRGGYVNTQFFCVGTTQVTYTLTDAAGNVSTCGFSVTVNDVEKPLVTCPPTKFINLDGGACGAFVNYNPAFAADNCAVVDTTMTPPSGSWFDIGNHLVTIVVTDAAGNTRSCTFAVNVIEYVPTDFNLICNDLSHVSMDATCVFVLNADEALEGDNYHCYDDYIITVKNQANQPVGNIFGSADIGKTFTITVKDPETGNSCWSLLKIEDKLVPALTCPADITIACSESTSVAHTGNVNIQDCSATTTVIDDEYTDFGQCNNPRGEIVRTWIVTDAWANQAACSQTITITPFSLNDVVFPTDVTINCETAYLNTAATDPDNTGRPSINGFPIGVGGLCTSSISYTDERFEICPGSYEILRTWKVRNTCFPVAPDNPISHVQVITVSDLGGPVFACPPTVTVSTNPFQCCSNTALPDMIVSEGCSHILDLEAKLTGVNPNNGNIITFTVGGSLADFPGNNYWNPDTMAVFGYTQCLPIGTYNVRYKATDECGNTSFCNFQLKVADLVPPAISCDQVTQVALTADGMAIVPAANFDDGTTDNCCAPTLDVRRMNSNTCTGTTFGPDVKFCCEDIGDTILVVLRARDCYDNVNECMVSVLVEDKIKPACQPPANVSVNCENFDPSLWSYGIPDVLDNCCLDNTKSYQSQIGLTHSVNYALFDTVCNKGTITRTFRAFDCSGNSSQCTQRVFVNYLQDYYVKF
ncbi:MAG TPA: HYR domain-containing protein, partial [Saprospiraceae bacterium]|nr:HYR domain-containing protein [Saprospiraceae bacterium]